MNRLKIDPFPVFIRLGAGRFHIKYCYFLGSFGVGKSSHGMFSINTASRDLGDAHFAIKMKKLLVTFLLNAICHKRFGGYFLSLWMYQIGDQPTVNRLFRTGWPQKDFSNNFHSMLFGNYGELRT